MLFAATQIVVVSRFLSYSVYKLTIRLRYNLAAKLTFLVVSNSTSSIGYCIQLKVRGFHRDQQPLPAGWPPSTHPNGLVDRRHTFDLFIEFILLLSSVSFELIGTLTDFIHSVLLGRFECSHLRTTVLLNGVIFLTLWLIIPRMNVAMWFLFFSLFVILLRLLFKTGIITSFTFSYPKNHHLRNIFTIFTNLLSV